MHSLLCVISGKLEDVTSVVGQLRPFERFNQELNQFYQEAFSVTPANDL